jgi:hypothetical protein
MVMWQSAEPTCGGGNASIVSWHYKITKSTLQLTFKGFQLQGKGSNFLEFAAKLIGGEGPSQ